MWTKRFWKQAFERAIKTAAQTALAVPGVDMVGLIHADWEGVLSVSGMSFILSILTSVVSAPIGDGDTPSVVK